MLFRSLYAKAIRTAHPNALQVSDRFHLLKGLTDAARQFVSSMVEQRIAIPSDTVPSSYWRKQSCSEPDLPQKLHNDTTKKRMASVEKVRTLALQGLNQKQICELSGQCSRTVKNYLKPDYNPEIGTYGVNHPSKLKPYCDTIDEMLGKRQAFHVIEAAIRKMGYCGSASTLRMYASRKRRHNLAIMEKHDSNTEVIERKNLLKMLYNPFEKMKGITPTQLDKEVALHPRLLSIYSLIRDFKALIAAKYVDDLPQWLESAKSLDSPDISSFVNGIKRDLDAVCNAIIYDYNNGLAEGIINKIKRIKHTMYGHAAFSTLRTKTLLYERCSSSN